MSLVARTLRFAILALLLLVANARAEVGREVVDIELRPGVTNRLLLVKPAAPVATIVLFAGGDGRLDIGANGDIRVLGGNFLIRTRERFASHGLLTIVADAPSDRQGPDGLGAYRLYAEHARDVGAIIAFARLRLAAPVWLAGTSLGTLSAGNAAVKLGSDGADGIVLTSTTFRGYKNRGSPLGDDIFDLDLAAIRVPVLIAHHRDDGCFVSPFADVETLRGKLKNSSEVGVLAYEGGLPPIAGACEGRAQHGYYGIEARVVTEIAGWIMARRR